MVILKYRQYQQAITTGTLTALMTYTGLRLVIPSAIADHVKNILTSMYLFTSIIITAITIKISKRSGKENFYIAFKVDTNPAEAFRNSLAKLKRWSISITVVSPETQQQVRYLSPAYARNLTQFAVQCSGSLDTLQLRSLPRR